MPGSHSLNFLGMCSCRRPLDSAPIGLCYICQCRRVSLSFFKPWNLAGCQLYTVHMACHWPPGVYSSWGDEIGGSTGDYHPWLCSRIGHPRSEYYPWPVPIDFHTSLVKKSLLWSRAVRKKVAFHDFPWIPDFGASLEAKISMIFQRPQRWRFQLWPNGGLLPFPFPSLIGLDVIGSHKLCHLARPPERHEIQHRKCRSNKVVKKRDAVWM